MADLEIKKENVITTGTMTLFLCNFCNECYSQERSFKLHYRAHKNFTCDTCGKVFSLKRDLTVHLRSHEAVKKQFVCDICMKGFNSKSSWKMHQRIHSNDESHVCDICKSVFNSKLALEVHCATHTMKKEEQYICDICQAAFHDKSNLETHSCPHIPEKPCISDKTVNDSRKRKSRQSIHKGSEHECDICRKTFKSKAILKKHCCHKGKISSVNNFSERAFNELSSSNTFPHYRTIKKPHVCDLCQTAFSRKSLLVSHNCIRKKKV